MEDGMKVFFLHIALLLISTRAHALIDLNAGRNLRIETISDLNFTAAIAGDPPQTISPGTSENGRNASFRITGNRFQSYTLMLPYHGVPIKTGPGGPGRTLNLSHFTSYPASGSGVLDGRGVGLLFVGATRSAISPNQVAGIYSGNFTITVVY
jgi:hypothetical protein